MEYRVILDRVITASCDCTCIKFKLPKLQHISIWGFLRLYKCFVTVWETFPEWNTFMILSKIVLKPWYRMKHIHTWKNAILHFFAITIVLLEPSRNHACKSASMSQGRVGIRQTLHWVYNYVIIYPENHGLNSLIHALTHWHREKIAAIFADDILKYSF